MGRGVVVLGVSMLEDKSIAEMVVLIT